ncbi:MAG: 3-oxoacyl-ACP reductase FabG [Oscillospiraceae bacterium]|nr:3-oxoacyl-ACP reductase FabG [Oscillospiraceae bacterium]
MKTALITGASGGIGYAIAEALAKDGYLPVLHCNRHADGMQERAASLGGIAVQADLSDTAQITRMTEDVLRQVGHVDVLVNNAGISVSGLLTDIDEVQRQKLFAVNVLGTIECTRALLPQMVHRKAGCILNISSMWGQVGASCEVDYSAAKAAVIGFTKALAQEVAPSGIRVNCIAPGVIRTAMLDCYDAQTLDDLAEETPLGRLGTPEDIAHAAAFLCSDRADFITGQVLGVNGGFVI